MGLCPPFSGLIHYLAYGSNLFGPRFARRVASARRGGSVPLVGWGLRFHKRSWNDGSGKCDIVRDPGRTVYCVVWAMDRDHRPALDAAEGLGNGYDERRMRVACGGQETDVFTYVAQPSHIDETLLPYRWYLELVIAGARENLFPPEYVAWLARVRARADPDRARAARERAILPAPLP